MDQQTKKTTFAFGRCTLWLTCAATLVAAILSLIIEPVSCVGLMAGVVWGSSLMGMTPVVWFGKLSIMSTLYAYFAGAGVRIVLCLAAVVVMIKVMNMPAHTVVISLMAVYLPLLFIEVQQVRRFILTADLPTTVRQSKPGPEASA
jgi:hypothetical protein